MNVKRFATVLTPRENFDMPESYKHHFQEMCDRLSYNCVVFLKGSGDVLAFRSTRPADEPAPRTCSVNVDYDAISADNSRVFYGLGLTLDGRMQIVSGSVSLVDLDGDIAVVVFYESRIASFRDNQLPRIFWKNVAGVYLGHSDYVPYENELKGSMVGKSDKELFSKAFHSDFEHSDRAVLDKEVCFWVMPFYMWWIIAKVSILESCLPPLAQSVLKVSSFIILVLELFLVPMGNLSRHDREP